ncbi:MAG: ATP-binding protein [Kiritimatiellia bacterium]
MSDQEILPDNYRLVDCPSLEDSSFAAINQVLMGLTHAMSNILMPLREYPRLILGRLPEDSSAVGLLSNMEIAADRLVEVNNNLIQLCHGNEGTPTRVNLVALSQLVLAEVYEQYPTEKPITVDLKTSSSPCVIEGPEDALYFAIRNLCVNAYEAMKQTGGTLVTLVEPCKVDKDDAFARMGLIPGDYLRLEVRDTGPGVDEHVRENLFEPFVTTVRGEGRGLGLSQTYRTIRHLGGRIFYQPDTGPGAAFMFMLPLVVG